MAGTMAQAPVTAIIPTYGRAALLRQAIESILSGALVPEEIIVVDDGSPDHTAAVVAGLGGPIRYVRQANAGKSAALNRGLSLAGQPLVWIMDDDDLARPDGLEHLYGALAADASAGFAYGQYEIFGDIGVAEDRTPLRHHPAGETFHLKQLLGCSVLQPAMLVRKACYDITGPFDTELLRSQDYDMLLRLARHYHAVEVGAAVFDQRQHDSARGTAALQHQRSSSVAMWRRYDARIFRKIHGSYELEEFLPPAQRGSHAARHRALVRRAAIMGRRGLWDLALADLERAGHCEAQAITQADIAIFAAALPSQTPSMVPVPLAASRRIVRSFAPDSRRPLDARLRAEQYGRWPRGARKAWRGLRRGYANAWRSRA